MTVNALDYAHEHGLTASIVAEDASRANTDFVIQYFRLGLNNGAKRLVYADTVGVLFPETTHVIIRDIIQQLKASHGDDVELAIHVHDDFGLATANTIAAVLEGVTYPQTCINGYGERAGNCALEEISVALEMNGIKTGIALEQLVSISKAAEEYFGIPITSHKPIVGGLAFSHESGIHVNALLMHPLTYEPIPPKKVGATRHFYIGKFSGMKSIADRLSSIGMEFPKPILQEIVEEVKQKQERKDKEDRKRIFHNILKEMEEIRMGVTDEEFWEIIRTVIKKHVEYQDQEKNLPAPKKKQKPKH
jgi:isopropylmalate/homocitrate/citramalate synthase